MRALDHRLPSPPPAPSAAFPLARPRSSGVPSARHAIVVFGCPAGPDGTPLPSLARRLSRALVEARRDPEAIVVVSGGAVHGPAEGPAMKRWLVAAGIDAQRVVVEPRARFTLENAELVAPLVAASGAREVTLVTEEFHMPRSRALLAGALAAAGAHARVNAAAAANGPARGGLAAAEREKLVRDLETMSKRRSSAREWVA